jgi:hypothetical protein
MNTSFVLIVRLDNSFYYDIIYFMIKKFKTKNIFINKINIE